MRSILPGDITAVALALLDLPEDLRQRRFQCLLAQTEAADLYRKHFNRAHPVWGDGSLMSTVGISAKQEPFLDDPEYCACLASIFEQLVGWRAEKASFNRQHIRHR